MAQPSKNAERNAQPRAAARLLILLALRQANPLGLTDLALVRFLEGLADSSINELRNDLCRLAFAKLIDIEYSSGEFWRARLRPEGVSFIERNAEQIDFLLEPTFEAIDV